MISDFFSSYEVAHQNTIHLPLLRSPLSLLESTVSHKCKKFVPLRVDRWMNEWIDIRMKAWIELTHRYQGTVPALLGRRPSFTGLRASSSCCCSSASSPWAALLPAARRRRYWLRLPVLVGALGLGLQAALVQGERLLPLQLQALQRRTVVAALAAVVMLPEELDPPPESLHHRAVSRCNKIRHHQSRLAGEKIPPQVSVAAVRFVHKMRLSPKPPALFILLQRPRCCCCCGLHGGDLCLANGLQPQRHSLAKRKIKGLFS